MALLLGISLPALHAYTGEPAPVFRLLADMLEGGPADGAVVAMHRRAFGDTARVRAWVAYETTPYSPVAARARARKAKTPTSQARRRPWPRARPSFSSRVRTWKSGSVRSSPPTASASERRRAAVPTGASSTMVIRGM